MRDLQVLGRGLEHQQLRQLDVVVDEQDVRFVGCRSWLGSDRAGVLSQFPHETGHDRFELRSPRLEREVV